MASNDRRIMGHKRVLVFIVAYNAEKTIQSVLSRIPADLGKEYYTEVLVIDDCSSDHTFELAEISNSGKQVPFRIEVLYNPKNQGYGGNQKIGFHYAIQKGFDFVALVHGDGQYAPECLPELLDPLSSGSADAVFGSRMLLPGGALKGGMPLYKFVGNKILTFIQNQLLGANLSEFHSGYRLYSTESLKKIPFDLNSNDFHFDTEIIIQLLFAKQRIKELSIPTYYGDEICHVNGIKYAWDVVVSSFIAHLQDKGIFYERKFDCRPLRQENPLLYQNKVDFESPHSVAVSMVQPGKNVVDIGCGPGHVCRKLKQKGCQVVGIDMCSPEDLQPFDSFIECDLDQNRIPANLEKVDFVIILDVIEHLAEPELFLESLRESLSLNPEGKIFFSTANIGFILTRLMMLFGSFNYGKRGILDLTHRRLFTFSSMRRILQQQGFQILSESGISAPFPLVFGNNFLGKMLQATNHFLILLFPKLFSYQMFFVAQSKPSLEYLLQKAKIAASQRNKDF